MNQLPPRFSPPDLPELWRNLSTAVPAIALLLITLSGTGFCLAQSQEVQPRGTQPQATQSRDIGTPISAALRTQTEDIASAPHMRASLISESAAVVPGQKLQLALRLQPDPGWHTYWRNPGDTGLATRIDWQLPSGFHPGEIAWPVPEWIDYAGLTNLGYHGDTWLLIPIAVPPRAALADLPLVDGVQHVVVRAHAKWLVCAEVCIPGDAQFELALPVAPVSTAGQPALSGPVRAAFARARAALPTQIQAAPAHYRVDDQQLELHVRLNDLPTLNRQPSVLVASKGLVAYSERPRVQIIGDTLVVSAAKDAYLEEPPHFAAFLLVTSAPGAAQTEAFELLAKYSPELVTKLAAAQSGAAILTTPAPTAASASPQSLVYILLLALLGGLILNLMPCVFPVLSLKIISLVEHGNHSARQRHRHGLAYTAGVVGSFLLVAAVLIALRGLGEQIGWGFQLQSPWFVGLLVYVLFLLGLSLSGVIELGTSLQNLGQGRLGVANGKDDGNNWHASFFTGVLATVVATPCTAPFMGTAMGFALSQPVYIALLTFAIMGLGLALPFLLIAYVPALAAALPAPGNWMVRLKEVLAFPIYLTVVWLLWVFSKQAGSDATAVLLAGLVLLALAAWLRRVTLYSSRAGLGKLLSAASLAAAIVLLVTGFSVRQAQPPEPYGSDKAGGVEVGSEELYSPARLQAALAQNKTVFVNMTADWCITCKVNERIALKKTAVERAFAEHEVIYLKGDWTNSDPQITEYLESFGRNGVPLYVVYKSGAAPAVLPQILTPGIVLAAIE